MESETPHNLRTIEVEIQALLFNLQIISNLYGISETSQPVQVFESTILSKLRREAVLCKGGVDFLKAFQSL